MSVLGVFGSTRFIIDYNDGDIKIDERSQSRVIFDDYESINELTVYLDGSRDIEAKGQYLNPKIIIKKTNYAEWENQLKPLYNKVVHFTPFADNGDWSFDCKVVSVMPLFEKGLYWKDYVEIQLQSTGYVDISAMSILWENPT